MGESLRCNHCPHDAKKTDRLKLKTIRGKDYLLCSQHYYEENQYGNGKYEIESSKNQEKRQTR